MSMRKNLLSLSVVGGSLLFGLSMLFTSCEGTLDDVFGEWDRPSGNDPAYSVTSITLDETSLELFVEGGEKTATLTATLVGDPGNEKVEFSSGDDTKATVDPTTGEVTAVSGGEVTIYANIGPTLQAQCKVMVYDRLHNISTDGAANIPDEKLWMITGNGSDKITIGEGSIAYLKDVTITTTADPCIETTGMGEIYLVDGTTNTMDAHSATKLAAIDTKGGQLTIFGQTEGTGKLIATGGDYGAGIGGSLNGNYNSIVIKGGEIEANGGSGAAGIGSGQFDGASSFYTNGDIIILGGKVTAKGGVGAAGIGTGVQASGTNPATCGAIKIDKTVVSVTAIMSSGAQEPIGKGHSDVSTYPVCGAIFFDTQEVAESAHGGASAYTTAPTNGNTYGGLKLAKTDTSLSGDTWTLTPAP